MKCNKFPKRRERENLLRVKQQKITSFFNTAADSEYTIELEQDSVNNKIYSKLNFMQIKNQKRIMMLSKHKILMSSSIILNGEILDLFVVEEVLLVQEL